MDFSSLSNGLDHFLGVLVVLLFLLLLLLGVLGVCFLYFISFFDENSVCKQKSPRWDAAAFCGVPSGAMLFACVQQKRRQALS